MTTVVKYLILGDGESPHLVKWVKALAPHFILYVVSSRGIHREIEYIVSPERCFPLNLRLDPDGGNINLLVNLPEIYKIVLRIKPDIVNAHYITSHGFIAAIIKIFSPRKFRLVQSAWGTDLLVTPWRNQIYRLITSFALRQADLITTDAKMVNEKVSLLSDRTITTFAFGVMVMPNVDMSNKEPWLFFSNRLLVSNYRIEKIIHHFSVIADKLPEARLLISNDGYLRPVLEGKIRDLNLESRVQFLGFLDERQQSEIYRKASFFYSLPESDATSVSLLEAMAWGCIPIVSDIPANRDWISHNKNGFIEEQGEIDDLLKLNNKRLEISDFNRALIREKAYFPDLIQQYADRIKLLISPS